MSRLLMDRLKGLPAYVPGEHTEDGRFIRLNTNESPYPPSPGVLAAVSTQVAQLGYYNDPDCTALRGALAALYGVGKENVICGNGSDELLYLAFMAFADAAHPIALPDITYSYYDLFAAALGIPLERIPLGQDFTVNPARYASLGRMIVLANPNAPTGLALSPAQIAGICASNPDSVVLIDEAYVDFGGETCLPLIEHYPNLLVVRTFSKSRSMAGARLGYAFGCAELIAALDTVRNAVCLYSVNRMTQAAGIAACGENDYYMENCRRIMASRRYALDALRALGFETTDSLGNFIFARSGRMPGAALAAALRERGILVRRWDAPRIADWLRITVGSQAEMEALVRAVTDILKEG